MRQIFLDLIDRVTEDGANDSARQMMDRNRLLRRAAEHMHVAVRLARLGDAAAVKASRDTKKKLRDARAKKKKRAEYKKRCLAKKALTDPGLKKHRTEESAKRAARARVLRRKRNPGLLLKDEGANTSEDGGTA